MRADGDAVAPTEPMHNYSARDPDAGESRKCVDHPYNRFRSVAEAIPEFIIRPPSQGTEVSWSTFAPSQIGLGARLVVVGNGF
jgi:hypothetical protein